MGQLENHFRLSEGILGFVDFLYRLRRYWQSEVPLNNRRPSVSSLLLYPETLYQMAWPECQEPLLRHHAWMESGR